MSTAILTRQPERKIRMKGLALPNEHGSWGFLFEPLVAGMAIAFSIAAPWIALMVIGAFLTRQPLKVLIADKLAGRRLPQTEAAFKFTLTFSILSLIGLGGSLMFAEPASFIPFALVLPFGVYQIYCDVSRKSRDVIPELTGAVAMSASVAAIATAGGLPWQNAGALWFLLAARLIPSILYVRHRLRLEKGGKYSILVPVSAHFAALGGIGLLAANGLLPYLTLAMFVLLLVRSAYGLSPFRTKMKAMKIGVWEVIYGVLTVLSVVVGHYLQI